MLFTKLFSSSEPGAKTAATKAAPAKPSPVKAPAAPAAKSEPPQRAESDSGGRPSKPADKEGSGRSRGGRRRGKKKVARAGDEGGRQEGQKQAKKKPRKKTPRKKAAAAQGKSGPANATQGDDSQNRGEAPKAATGSETAAAKGETGAEQKQDGSGRKGRRRRSPYQTSGAKQRDGQPAEGDKKSHEERSAETGNQPERAPAAEQLALPAAGSSKGADVPVEVVKDNKGIYTLKPASPDKKAESPVPASSGSSQGAAVEPADRA
jgi:hypothetical protein